MTIKLEKLNENKKEGKVTFLIKGGSEIFANTIRRLVVEEVPTLAVEDLEIKYNDSALYDEMLALRIGLCPLKTDLGSYRLPESQEEIDERSARCTLQLRLKASRKGYIYAEDAESSDPKCKFVYPKMPLTKLLSKQKIDITLIAVMGQGKDHIKWSPGWAFYRKEPTVKVGKADADKIAKVCTDGVFKVKGGKVTVDQEKANQSNLLDYYAESDMGVSVDYTDNIIFTLESWGQLSTKEILTTAADLIVSKANEMEKLI